MLAVGDTQSGIPAFLVKLWRLVEDPTTNDLISWRPDGVSFVIKNQSKFSSELLPLNYKHNNMASFIRQLNMYGFHKVASIENGGLRFKDEMEFSHPDFRRGEYPLLNNIKRKIATAKGATVDAKKTPPESINRVLTEVKAIRGKQDSLDSRFSTMKQENEALWRELVVLRQKHIKQQQIVNKLIQFLVTIVQPSRSGLKNMNGVKRRYQLMISDQPQSSETENRPEKSGPVIQEYFDEDSIDNILTDNVAAAAAASADDDVDVPEDIDEDDDVGEFGQDSAEAFDVGRVIEERLLEENNRVTDTENDDNLKLLPVHASPKKPKLSINAQLPDLSTQSFDVDLSLLNTPVVESPKQDKTVTWYGKQEDFLQDSIPDDLLENPFVEGTSSGAQAPGQWVAGKNLALAKINTRNSLPEDIFNLSTPASFMFREQFDTHLEHVQQDLNSLQEMLNGEGYAMDVNPLDGLFGDSSEILSYPVTLDEEAAADATAKRSQ
ncbi:heat shock factor protein isoform X2 [Phlebotomus argentipes]|uniref:heat shock factor protein isoform X2 n=1 Tax=Phlebotomus argentipes TaxID=94469 RepID=UPI0028931752|nr:heat shock factor protein isoform X2 [Phlebotomus argentipes]